MSGPKTFYFKNATAPGGGAFGSLQDGGTPPGTATTTTGYTPKKTAAGNFALMVFGSSVPSTSFGATARPASTDTPSSSAGCAWRSEQPLTGSFASGTWTFKHSIISSGAAVGTGAVTLRIFLSKNADGSAAREITTGMQTCTAISPSTSTPATSTLTFNPGGFSPDDEYLFLVEGWDITVAGASNSSACLYRTDASNSVVTTSSFSVGTTLKLYLTDTAAPSSAHGSLSPSAPGGAANTTTGWALLSNVIGPGPYSEMVYGGNGPAFASSPAKPSGPPVTNDCWRSVSPYTADIAAGRWFFNAVMDDAIAGGALNALRIRIWKSTDPTGTSGVTELTTSTIVSSGFNTALSPVAVTAFADLAAARLDGHYLFYQLAINEQGSGPAAQGTVVFRVDPTSSYTLTPAFEPSGVLNTTLAGTTLASSAKAPAKGTLTATLANVTLSASSHIVSEGALSATLADVTLASATKALANGTLSSQLANIVLTASAKVRVTGSLSALLANMTLLASSHIISEGSLTAQLADATLISQGHLQPVSVGSLFAILANVIATARAQASTLGVMNGVERIVGVRGSGNMAQAFTVIRVRAPSIGTTLEVGDDIVLVETPAIITMPDNPYPGELIVLVSDGANMTLEGGAHALLPSDPVVVPAGRLVLASFTENSGWVTNGAI